MHDEMKSDARRSALNEQDEDNSSTWSQDPENLGIHAVELLMDTESKSKRIRTPSTELPASDDALRQVTKNKDASNVLVGRLREANENLVVATLDAQELQTKAETTIHRQEEFLSMLAHELRNPLAPILMAADLLNKVTSTDPQLPKLQGVIARQARHMKHLVNDLLDASLISRGKIVLQKSAVMLSEIIESAVETSQPFIAKRHQHLHIAMPVPKAIINGDVVRLSQIFSNLLINATKFTGELGHIEISAVVHSDTITVTVKDDGIGIDAEIQPVIFDLFQQGPCSLDRSQGGLGVGLSLVRHIAQLHGGSVEVRSKGIGHGCEFDVTLPIAAESQVAADNVSTGTAAVRGRRILLIDDNADANEILKDLLSFEGHVVTSAFDGPSGLAMAINNVYDVILCDIGLPGLNGYEVAKQLRLRSTKPIPYFIAITGYNQAKDEDGPATAGLDQYLVKPVAIDVLLNLISTSTIA